MISPKFEDRWQAYLSTYVRIQPPELGRIEVRPAPIGHIEGQFPDPSGRTIFVMTAHNPGHQLSAEDNDRRQSALVRAVHELPTASAWPAVGGDPSWQHSEESLAILGIAENDAVALARSFDQDAIFAWTPSEWVLVACEFDRRQAAGWSAAVEL